MFKAVVSLVLSVVMVGCASGPAKKSQALQAAEAGGIKNLRDVTQAEIEKAYREKQNTGGYYALTGAGVATGVFDPTTGASPAWESAALFAMAFLVSGKQASDFSRVLVWMPQSEAASPEEAMLKWRALVTEAYKKALPDAEVKLNTETVEGKKGLIMGGGTYDKEKAYLSIHNAGCEKTTGSKGCHAYVRSIELVPSIDDAPDFLGGGKAYVWDLSSNRANVLGYPFVLRNESPDLDGEARIAILERISAQLPAWVYFYVAPGKTLLSYPFVVNQGKRLYFVETVK